MILFLDFDGVLHSDGTDGPNAPLFCKLPDLEALLRQFPRVRVVISSTWREHHSLDELRVHFSPGMRTRIIGSTPGPRRDGYGYAPAQREDEIVAWLVANGGSDQPWVALDDADWQFSQHLDQLVVCNHETGFDDRARDELRQHFERGYHSENTGQT
jgi:hypothetical protein